MNIKDMFNNVVGNIFGGSGTSDVFSPQAASTNCLDTGAIGGSGFTSSGNNIQYSGSTDGTPNPTFTISVTSITSNISVEITNNSKYTYLSSILRSQFSCSSINLFCSGLF